MAIGIFDSGVGGLTVFNSISSRFPKLDIYYLGDTARVPYGSRSQETIIGYSLECAGYLVSNFNVDSIVIACNTASSYAVEAIEKKFVLPVTGVVLPGAEQALKVSKTGRIGVIGTRATVRSGSYRKALELLADRPLAIFEKACPLFVPIVEEMMADTQIAELTVKNYLNELAEKDIDTLILGCTHYPVLKPLISKLYPDFNIVDSAQVIIEHLEHCGINFEETGIRKLFVTDESPAFEQLKNELAGGAPTERISLLG
jgi:glutamate racemase